MTEKSVSDLKFVRSREPIPTVEIDMDSMPEGFFGYTDLVAQALQPIAAASPKMLATLYVYQGPSSNFGEQTFSAFIGVAGPQKLLNPLLSGFKKISGIKARMSDYIDAATGQCEFHVQDGEIWQPIDMLNWFSEKSEHQPAVGPDTLDSLLDVWDADEINEADITSEIGSANTISRTSSPIRFRAARSDASIGSIRQKIEKIFGLPEGSVVLCGPDKKGLRADATIATLKKRWE